MPFTLVGFGQLQISIKESIKAVLSERGLDTKDPEKSVENLSKDKRIRCRFLLITSQLLESSRYTPFQRQLILNAACYFVHQEIEKAYRISSPASNKLYEVLRTSLAFDKDNIPSKHHSKQLFSELRKFILAHVFIDSDPSKGFLSKQSYEIKDFDISDDITKLNGTLTQLDIEIMAQAQLDKKNRKPLNTYANNTVFWGQEEDSPTTGNGNDSVIEPNTESALPQLN